MAAWLAMQGHIVNRKGVQRLMRVIGLVAIHQRPNTSKNPNAQGFSLPGAIMDWHSRAVLAWQLSNTLGAEFCVEALEEALARYGKPEIFNTDQGCQFTSS
jgi:putative transposase